MWAPRFCRISHPVLLVPCCNLSTSLVLFSTYPHYLHNLRMDLTTAPSTRFFTKHLQQPWGIARKFPESTHFFVTSSRSKSRIIAASSFDISKNASCWPGHWLYPRPNYIPQVSYRFGRSASTPIDAQVSSSFPSVHSGRATFPAPTDRHPHPILQGRDAKSRREH